MYCLVVFVCSAFQGFGYCGGDLVAVLALDLLLVVWRLPSVLVFVVFYLDWFCDWCSASLGVWVWSMYLYLRGSVLVWLVGFAWCLVGFVILDSWWLCG